MSPEELMRQYGAWGEHPEYPRDGGTNKFNETPQEQVVRLYTETELTIPAIMEATQVSRPTLFRYLKQAKVTLNRRSPTLAPGINAPTMLGVNRRISISGTEPAPTIVARRKVIEADCLPLEQPYLAALRFHPDQVQTSLDILHSLNLTLLWTCIGSPASWGTWLAGPKHFTDPALNPMYPLNLEACVAVLEHPKDWVVGNAEKIKGYVARVRLERTEEANKLVSEPLGEWKLQADGTLRNGIAVKCAFGCTCYACRVRGV